MLVHPWRNLDRRSHPDDGLPTIGTLAFDVKAKSIYDDHILIDAYEHRTFRNFETSFNISVWYVCFPPAEPHVCHLLLNRDLQGEPTSGHGRPVLAMPLKSTVTTDLRRDFLGALVGAISLR